MKTEREALLSKLRLLKPAVAGNTPMPELQCVWLDGKAATAYNDIIGIETPFESDFKGGLVGAPLLGLMESSSAETAAITANGESVSLSAGGTKAKLPLLSLDRCPFTIPKVAAKIQLGNDFLPALDFAMVVLQNVTGFTGAGVTIEVDENTLTFYATDTTVLAWAPIARPKGFPDARFVLSVPFCEQLAALGKEGASLFLDEQKSLATFANGSRLFGRFVEQKGQVDYAASLVRFLPETDPIPIPDGLAAALDRAVILSGSSAPVIECRIEGGALHISLNGGLGELRERLPLAGKKIPDQPATKFDASMLRRVLSRVTDFTFTDKCFIFLGKDTSGYLCAAVS